MKVFFTFLILMFFGGSAVFAYTADEIVDLKRRALKGENNALIELAGCYERGDGVPVNRGRALLYYLVVLETDAENESVRERIIALGGGGYLPKQETGTFTLGDALQGVDSEFTTIDEALREDPPQKESEDFSQIKPSDDLGKIWLVNLGEGGMLELLRVSKGRFKMGSPVEEVGRLLNENQVSVRITKPFYLGKTEVTQAQWFAVMGINPMWPYQYWHLPVANISWDDAMAFCKKLTEREHAAGRLSRNWRYTLPTEAQWEYACRAGTTTPFCSGNSEWDLSRVAWWVGNSPAWGRPTVLPNAWGFYDMHGGVWEWCSDWYADSLRGGSDPTGAQSGLGRVVRGGSCINPAFECRSARRDGQLPSWRNSNVGVRVALVQE